MCMTLHKYKTYFILFSVVKSENLTTVLFKFVRINFVQNINYSENANARENGWHASKQQIIALDTKPFLLLLQHLSCA